MNLAMSSPLELGRTGAGRPYGILNAYLKHQGEIGRIDYRLISGLAYIERLYGKAVPPNESLEQGAMSDQLIAYEDPDELVSSDVFLGCGCASLAQMRKIADERTDTKFTKLVTTWFSSHYRNASRILSEEYPKVGVQNPFPVDPYLMWRDEKEHALSDLLIVPSQACADTYEEDPLCKGKTRVVNFGVDSVLYHPPEKPVTDFRVLFAGGNWIRKGLPYLVRAWNAMKLPDGVLTTVGCQVPPVKIHRNANLGWVSDDELPKIYRKNSVFCVPTLEEGQMLACLEAMASGMAIITTKESGVPIEDGKDGLLIPSGDSNAIADALMTLHEHPEETKKMGEAARKKAEEMTWERFGEGVLSVCEEAASR